jgi:hypothetical protein
MRGVKVTVGVGLLLAVVILGITLSHAPITVAQVNTPHKLSLGTLRSKTAVCQAGESLPRGTSAIRLRVFAFTGPRVTVRAYAGGRVVAQGEHGSGWTGGAVTVPVRTLRTATSGATLCFSLLLNGDEGVFLTGEPTSAALAARGSNGRWPGRLTVEYLRPGHSSWWSIAPEVARRMGLGNAAGGTWIAILALALMSGVVALSSRLVIRELR